MDNAIETVLERFHERSARESELMTSLPPEEFRRRLDEFLLPIGPEAGRFLNLMVKISGAVSILEVGTSHGYSALWLAEAARQTGGKVVTLDVHEGKQQYAREVLGEAGLSEIVDFRLGDALEAIGRMDQPVDFVLLDIWKDQYIPCFDAFKPLLAPGALVAADNILVPENFAGQMALYQDHVRAAAGMESVLVPIGNGIELTRFAG